MSPPDNLDAIRRRIAELQAQEARLLAAQARGEAPPKRAPRKTRGSIRTDGGAVVEGSVRLASGHFIGRDSIQIIRQLVQQGEDPEHAQLALASYLHALAADLAGLKLGDIDASPDQTKQVPLELPDVYVPLDTTFRLRIKTALATAVKALRAPKVDLRSKVEGGSRIGADESKLRAASVLEALATHSRLTLIGPPGSGKSTFGAHVLLALAQAWQGKASLTERLGERWTGGQPLPLRVVLRSFAERHAAGAEPPSAGDLWAFIGDDLRRRGWGDAKSAMHAVQTIARRHGALVLFDGLDECGDQARRGRVLAAVEAFEASAGEHSRFLLTARPYACPEGADPAKGVYLLAELDNERIEQFIRRWYDALVKRGWQNAEPAAARREDLIAAYSRPDLRHLAGNPLLLTLMATLHSNRGRLPADRVDLHEETVTLLLQRWNRDVGADRALLDMLNVPGLSLRDFRRTLERLAFEVHEANEGRQGLADIAESQLLFALRPLVGGDLGKAQQVVEFIERRAGLLLGLGAAADGGLRFTFPHRTFQEFLAACHLHRQSRFAADCRRLAEKAAGHWREVLPLAARLAGADRGAVAAAELIGARDHASACARAAIGPADWARVHLAALMLGECGQVQLDDQAITRETVQRVKTWLVAGLPLHPASGGAAARERAAMGDALAALGDPRFDADRYYLPGNDSILGFERIAGQPLLAVARYPVTVAQFRIFLRATGREPDDPDALRDPASRPVRWVNWHEAIAYAKWLEGRLGHDPQLADTEAARLVRSEGWRVGLPNETEWELAARGGLQGKSYPWGDEFDPERANTDECGVGDTSVVGCFAANGFGLFDMAGNVWEWTRTLAEDDFDIWKAPNKPNPETEDNKNDKPMVLRGGCFLSLSVDARCAFRGLNVPDDRNHGTGFRVVLRSAPVL